LDPSGYGQYVEQKFVPAGSITATSMPVNDVGGPVAPVQSRIPDTPAKTEGIPAAVPIIEESGSNRHRGEPVEPVDTPTVSKSPIVASAQGTEGGKAVYTVNQHADGSYSGTYANGTPMDPTTIDETGVRFPPLQPISSGPVPVRTTGNSLQDILSRVSQGLIPKSKAGEVADAADKYSDGKVDGALGRVDKNRAATDPAYAAGAAEGVNQRNAALERAAEKAAAEKDAAEKAAAEKAAAEKAAAEKAKAATGTPPDSGTEDNIGKGKGGDNGPSDSDRNEIKETGDTRDGDTVYKAGNAKMV
jgi:hypothetical protein